MFRFIVEALSHFLDSLDSLLLDIQFWIFQIAKIHFSLIEMNSQRQTRIICFSLFLRQIMKEFHVGDGVGGGDSMAHFKNHSLLLPVNNMSSLLMFTLFAKYPVADFIVFDYFRFH